ncbi:YtrH family sporulation protein [Maledivibacter halophilus]|uniref:Sporulation protein YtrH n=1 Tax=Maledivibacter halophilus TaxID=36842 RepID=A0A1T5LCR5_9FIRM|nr:YtrH family sporulation protein [Maledivibacter halophilus]SKC73817.1 Sporulation protein YtrH [Maledivibacter halophilus]
MFFINNLVYTFLIALGVIIGAGFFAGIGALINNHPPLKTMIDISSSIKIWAVAVSLGGTFSSFEIIEQGIFKGEIRSVVKQVSYIAAALIGANLGYLVIKLLYMSEKLWKR